jgi:hypothetical protein
MPKPATTPPVPFARPALALIQEIRNRTRALDRRIAGLLQQSGPFSAPLPVPQAMARLAELLGDPPDLVMRMLVAPAAGSDPIGVFYLSSLVDATRLEQAVIAPILQAGVPPGQWDRQVLSAASVTARGSLGALARAVAAGEVALLAGGGIAWTVDLAQFPQRSVGRPQTELTVRGPNEAFTELLTTQIAQIRHRFPHPALRLRQRSIGRLQHSKVAVVYVQGVTNPALVASVLARLDRIRLDGRANATTLGGLIRDHPRSIFPTIRSTERVDIATYALLQGKVVILVDGDCFALIAPAPLADFYRTAMDYSGEWYDASFIRFIRLLGWAIGVYLPGLYIALTEVNTNLLPPALLILTAGDHAGLPFPPIVEAFLMVFVIEVLREAALRLPTPLSTTIGTVGAIVVGTAVVKAGLVSPQMIVVITLTALSFYSVPIYALTGTWRLVNFLMLVAASVVGLYGLILVTLWLVGELTSLSSFGVPYFAPLAPFRPVDWWDVPVRVPWGDYRRRWTAARPKARRWISGPNAHPRPHLRRRRPALP